MKNGESPQKTGTSATKKVESSKKRFGLKAKPPPPAPRQPRARQRLGVTVLGVPNADHPLFEDPLLLDLMAEHESPSTPPAPFSESPLDLSWPPVPGGAIPAVETPTGPESGLYDIPAGDDTLPDSLWPSRSWPAHTVDETTAVGEVELDPSWPSPAPMPEILRPVARRTRAPEPAETPRERPAAKAPVAKAQVAKSPVAKASIAKAPVAKAPVAKTPVAKAPIAKASVAKAPVAKTPVAKAPIAKAPVAEVPVANSAVVEPPVAKPPAVETAAATPTAHTQAIQAPLLEIPRDPSPTPSAQTAEPTPLDIPVDLGHTPPTRTHTPAAFNIPVDLSPTPPTETTAPAVFDIPVDLSPTPAAFDIPVDLSPTPPIPSLPTPRPAARRNRETTTGTPAPAASLAESTVAVTETTPQPGSPREARAIETPPDVAATPAPATPAKPVATSPTPTPARARRTRATAPTAPVSKAPEAPVASVAPTPTPSPTPRQRPARPKHVPAPTQIEVATTLPGLTPPQSVLAAPPPVAQAPQAQADDSADAIAALGWPSPGELWSNGPAAQAAPSESDPVAESDGFRPYRQISERDARREGIPSNLERAAKERMQQLSAAWDLSTPDTDGWTAPPPVKSRFFSAEAVSERDATQRRSAEPAASADHDGQPGSGDRDWLEARLASAERELQRVEMRTHGQNGDLRNARRREIAEAVRQALGDRELATHFDLRVDNGLFAFQRRRPGVSAGPGPIRGAANILVADSAGRIRQSEPVRPDDLD